MTEATNLTPRCATCNAYQSYKNGEGVCRARPAVPLLYGMQPSVIQGQRSQAVVVAHFPSMMDTGWCREYQMRTDGNA